MIRKWIYDCFILASVWLTSHVSAEKGRNPYTLSNVKKIGRNPYIFRHQIGMNPYISTPYIKKQETFFASKVGSIPFHNTFVKYASATNILNWAILAQIFGLRWLMDLQKKGHRRIIRLLWRQILKQEHYKIWAY